jgi:hypothetical protein
MVIDQEKVKATLKACLQLQVHLVDLLIGEPVPNPLKLSVSGTPGTMVANFAWDNTGYGPITLDPGDGSAPVPLGETGTHAHSYATPGTYNAVGTDADDPSRIARLTVTVPFV